MATRTDVDIVLCRCRPALPFLFPPSFSSFPFFFSPFYHTKPEGGVSFAGSLSGPPFLLFPPSSLFFLFPKPTRETEGKGPRSKMPPFPPPPPPFFFFFLWRLGTCRRKGVLGDSPRIGFPPYFSFLFFFPRIQKGEGH